MAEAVTLPPNKILYDQGASQDHLYIVTDGVLRLSHLLVDGRRQVIGFLGPGDLLGGFRSRSGAYCSTETITTFRACSFTQSDFSTFLEHHPDFCMTLLAVATDEIEAQYEHSILLARRQAKERIAAFLLIMRGRWQYGHEARDVIHLPMSRSDVADYLGLTGETVSRVLNRFKQDRIISFRGPKTVVLKNIAALDEIAAMDRHPSSPRMAIGL
jgi:CRP/FNR family transcriptional regulator